MNKKIFLSFFCVCFSLFSSNTDDVSSISSDELPPLQDIEMYEQTSTTSSSNQYKAFETLPFSTSSFNHTIKRRGAIGDLDGFNPAPFNPKLFNENVTDEGTPHEGKGKGKATEEEIFLMEQEKNGDLYSPSSLVEKDTISIKNNVAEENMSEMSQVLIEQIEEQIGFFMSMEDNYANSGITIDSLPAFSELDESEEKLFFDIYNDNYAYETSHAEILISAFTKLESFLSNQ
jgi:hypothetical protein